MKLWPWALY